MEIMNWIKENQGKTVLIVVVLVALVYLGLHHKKEHQTLSKDEKMKKREQEKLKNEEKKLNKDKEKAKKEEERLNKEKERIKREEERIKKLNKA